MGVGWGVDGGGTVGLGGGRMGVGWGVDGGGAVGLGGVGWGRGCGTWWGRMWEGLWDLG